MSFTGTALSVLSVLSVLALPATSGTATSGTVTPSTAMSFAASRQQPPAASPVGTWEGNLDTPRRPVVMTLRLEAGESDVRGTVEFSGQQSIPIRGTREGGTLILGGGDPRVDLTVRADGPSLTGTMTQRGVTFPFRLEREPDLPPPASRAEAWRQDLDVAVRKLTRDDRSLSPAAAGRYRAAVAALRRDADRKSDAELIAGLARAVALAGNAHTRLYILRNRSELRRLPVRVWWFEEGLHVVRATAPHRDLVGCEVMRIDGRSVQAVRKAVAPLFAGNPSWQTYMSVYSMTSPEVLAGLGLARDMEAIAWQFRCGDRPATAVLRPLPVRKRAAPTEAWWDLSPAYTAGDNKEWVSLPLKDALPLYLRAPDTHYSHEYLADRQALYLRYFRSQQQASGPPFNEYVQAIARELEGKALSRVVIDLRFNTGGDLGLGRAAMEALRALARDKGAETVVISGRATFSAGLFHLASWKAWGARIVGEPAGDDLDFWAEGGNIILPNSKLAVHYANGFHGYSTRDYPRLKPYFTDLDVETVAPDVVVPMTWEAYRRGEDTALAAALRK